ncbi:MAG: hypothetical protein GY828_03885 [Candidatus Gracilibacteria bacterium]|nr:hypothetical protein [Candidatus Gracilibacteria bacterium]
MNNEVSGENPNILEEISELENQAEKILFKIEFLNQQYKEQTDKIFHESNNNEILQRKLDDSNEFISEDIPRWLDEKGESGYMYHMAGFYVKILQTLSNNFKHIIQVLATEGKALSSKEISDRLRIEKIDSKYVSSILQKKDYEPKDKTYVFRLIDKDEQGKYFIAGLYEETLKIEKGSFEKNNNSHERYILTDPFLGQFLQKRFSV